MSVLIVDSMFANLPLQLEDFNRHRAFKRLPEQAEDFHHQALAAGNGSVGLLIEPVILLASRTLCRTVVARREDTCLRAAAAVEHCLALAFGGGFGSIP